MLHMLRLPAFLTTALVIGVLAQSPTPKGGYFKATPPDGSPPIGLEFDSSGTINVYIGDQAYGKSSWEIRKDTMVFGPVVGADGSGCPNSASYLWALADNVLSFKLLKDDCELRMTPLVNLVWTKG